MIELYEIPSTQSWAVRMIYRGEHIHPPMCETSQQDLCDYKKFMLYTKTLIPEDPKTECKLTLKKSNKGGLRFAGEEDEDDDRMIEYPIALLVVIIVLSITIVLLGICLLRKEIQMHNMTSAKRFSYSDGEGDTEALLGEQDDADEGNDAWRRMTVSEQQKWEDEMLKAAEDHVKQGHGMGSWRPTTSQRIVAEAEESPKHGNSVAQVAPEGRAPHATRTPVVDIEV